MLMDEMAERICDVVFDPMRSGSLSTQVPHSAWLAVACTEAKKT